MAELAEIVEFLEKELRTADIPDYEGAHNGLQLQNSGKVTKVAAAVDASLPIVEKAIAAGADLLVVHHGIFWQGVRPFVDSFYQKVKIAMEGDLAIYSSHIPLDVHDKWGNNVILAEKLALGKSDPFHDWKGIQLGRLIETKITLAELQRELAEVVGGPVLAQGTMNRGCGKVGIITGGAGSEVETIAKEGINTFITGEGPHWSAPLADELGLNILYAGHYATETFGVSKVSAVLSDRFGLESAFIDQPSGL